MEIRVLGPLQVVEDGRSLPLGGHRQRMVLAALLVHHGEVVSTDRLVDDVWGDEPPATARKSLQVYVSRLRKQLGDEVIEAAPPGYVLHTDRHQIDADRFEQLAEEGRRLLTSNPAAAAETLRSALALWHGAMWGDLADEPALRPVVERLRERRLAVIEDRLEADLELGRTAMVLAELEEMVAAHPLRERVRGLLMRALYQAGRQAEALRAYQDTRRALAEELGIEPSPELQHLEEQILLQDRSLQPPERTEESPLRRARNPYKGLRAFGEGDADDFYGRGALIEELLSRIAADRFVVAVGPSGSGKSSVVRAGVVPALRAGAVPGSETWGIATMVPGAHPFEELEAALLHAAPDPPPSLAEQMRGDDLDLLRAILRVTPDEHAELTLVIDQLEELFLLVPDEEVRRRFIRNVVEAVEDPHSRLRVVATLRADYFDRPLQYAALAPMVVDGQVAVLPLGAADLEAAAVRPAAEVGITFEPDVIAELVGDVVHQPGVLPLFQFVLTELFDNRTAETLSLAEYHRIGGLHGALSRRAEDIFARLDHQRQSAVRQVFLRLVTLGEGGEDTRRRVHRVELESLGIGADDVGGVLEMFGDARLLTFDRDPVVDQPTVELAHEAMLREWPRLRNWINGARDDLRLQRSVATEAADWEAAGRNPDYLLTGTRLGFLEEWNRTTSLKLTTSEQEFLEASRARRSEETAAERDRMERERALEQRALRRLQGLVAVLAVAAIVGAVLTGIAINRSQEASRQAEVARQETEVAEAARAESQLAAQRIRIQELTAAALANRVTDRELSLLLLLHAADIADAMEEPVPADTIAAFHFVLQGGGRQFQYPESAVVPAVLAGPDGLQGIFRLDMADLVAFARAEVTRSLSDQECLTYFGFNPCPLLSSVFSAGLAADEPQSVALDPVSLAGTRVSVLGVLDDFEAEAFRAEMRRFATLTGISVEYDALDLDRILDWVGAGRGPDLMYVPQPGLVRELGVAGVAIDLSRYLDVETLKVDMSPHLVSLGTIDADGIWPAAAGALYGLPARLNVKSLIWYPVQEFEAAGYEVPTTWDELLELTDQMLAAGETPWCHGEGDFSPSTAGWPGTDWIEDLLLHEAGPAAYDRWVSHDLPFASDTVGSAWQRLGDLLLDEGRLYGGQEYSASWPWAVAVGPMFEDPPGCWLTHQPNFLAGFLPHGVVPGRDAAFFPIPTINPEWESSVLGAGVFAVAVTDRPEVRELVSFLAGRDYGVEQAKVDPGFIAPNRHFASDGYVLCEEDDLGGRTCVPNQVTRSIAEILVQALEDDAFRFDGSDLMPFDFQLQAFWPAMVEYIGEGPDNLDEILARLDAQWEQLATGSS